MQGKTHELIGLATTASVFTIMYKDEPPVLGAIMITGAIIGSLFPDIDAPTSTINKKYKFITWPFLVCNKVLKFLGNVLGPFKSLSKLFMHRGIMHSPLLYLSLFFLLYRSQFLNNSIFGTLALGFFIGVFSHLIADLFSGGIPLFCPLYNKKIAPFIRFKSDGAINIVMIALSCLIFIYNIFIFFTNL